MDSESLRGLASALLPNSPDAHPDIAPLALRRFSTWEICTYILPMAPNHLRRSLRAHPDWPQGQAEDQEAGQMRWFTLSDIHRLRRRFAQTGRGGRHLPDRPAGAPLVLALTHPRPGTGRSTTAAHLAQAAALAGYRVLVLDLCPSARLTRLLGASSPATALPLIAIEAARHLREENRLRLSRGEPMLTPDTDLEGSTFPAPSSTQWAGVSLLGGGIALAAADLRIAGWQNLIRSWRPWSALRDGLAAAGYLAPSPGPAMLEAAPRYDLILIDTPPVLGPLTLTALATADILVMPFAATPEERRDTARALTLLSERLSEIETREGLAARALGEEPPRFRWSALRGVLTRFSSTSQRRAAAQLQAQMGEALLPVRQEYEPLLADPKGPGTIYAMDYRDIGRDRFAALRRDPDAIAEALFEVMGEVWREKGRTEAV